MEQQITNLEDCRIKVGPRFVLTLDGIQIGARLSIDGQPYELVRIHEFKRKHDGSMGTLYDWKAPCADCGKEFITTSSPSGAMMTRRCREHRSAGKAVRGGGRRQRMTVTWLPPIEKAGAGTPPATGPTSA